MAAHKTTSDPRYSPNHQDEPSPGTKTKHRLKLWDSFLSKTRKILVKKEKSQRSSKLEKRASSHPNISSYTAVTDITYSRSETATATKCSPNVVTEEIGSSILEYRSNKYVYKRGISRSATRLHDSSSEFYSPATKKSAYKVSFDSSQESQDNECAGAKSNSVKINQKADHKIRKLNSTESQDLKSQNDTLIVGDIVVDSSTGSEDDESDGEDKDDDVSDGEDKDDDVSDGEDDDVSDDNHNLPQISKSMDSLLTVASGIILPQVTAVQTNRSSSKGYDKLFSNVSRLDVSATPFGQIRRHSYDIISKKQREDSSEYFDCYDYILDSDKMSSSLELSTEIQFNAVVHDDSADTGTENKDGCMKEECASPPEVGNCLSSDRLLLYAGTDHESDSKMPRLDIPCCETSQENVVGCSHASSVTVQTNDDEEPSAAPSVESEVQQYSTFMLNIHLQEGRDLVIRDACGTSDPYVKFIIGNKVMYKSRIILKNLNPCWDERFTIPVDDITKPLILKVFDYDRAWSDDPMGGAELDLTTIVVNKETELKVMLTEKDKEEYMGYLLLTFTLIPKLEDNKELDRNKRASLFQRSTRSTDSKKSKMQLWSGVVNIVLVEGFNLVSMDDNGFSDPYVRFKLGMEKYRSKFKTKTLHPRWLEQFDLHLYEEQTTQLEIEVYDHDTRGKDDFMGRAIIDLSTLEKETTHVIEQKLDDGAGTIKLLLTITATIGHELTSDLTNYMHKPRVEDSIISKYGLLNSFTSLDDIGCLEVKVFRAHGLQAADFGGFSDPFCVLELINDRVQTHTEYKTLNPEWSKVFTFRVRDIHSVLEITVYDEDRNKKVEFLGKISIPLLKIRNYERRWYALKDRKMIHKTKGAILLEMNVVFNHIKAAIRTVNPREPKLIVPEEKFKIAVMKENINRMSRLIGVFIDTGKFIQSCFDWQSPPRSITAFVVYLIIVWNFELYMLPLSLLLVFMKNLLVAQVFSSMKKEPMEDDYVTDEDEDDDNDKEKQEEKKSIIDRYHAIQEVCLTVQQALDKVASLGERVKNTFNWSVPWLSTLAVIALLAGSIILFYIPLRYLLLIWGINKFTKKLRKPNAISNNELLDFLSRVPSDNELLQYRELRPEIPANTPSKKKRS